MSLQSSRIVCYPLPVEAAELSPEIIQRINQFLRISDVEEYKSTYERIDSFLRSISTDKIRNKVYVAVIKGEWGEGKTTSYFIYVKPLAKERYRLLPIRANMLKIIDYLEKYGSQIDFENYAQLLLYLLIVNSDEFSDTLKTKYDNILFNASDIITRFVKEYLGDRKGLVVFIDEFEELVGERGGINIAFHSRSVKVTLSISQIIVYGIREITRDLGRELLEQLNKLREFRLGIVIAMTPYTFIEFKNILGGYETAGKILTMMEIIELSRLSKTSNVRYINAIIGSACKDGNIDSIFSDRRLVNTIHLIGSGNSRAILQLVNRLITYKEERGINKIGGREFIEAYKSYHFYIYLNPNDAINNEVVELINTIKDSDTELYNFLINSIAKTIVSRELGDRGLTLIRKANQLFLRNYGFKLFIKSCLFKIDNLSLAVEVINKMIVPILKFNLQLEEYAYAEEYRNELKNAIRKGLYNLLYYTNKGYVMAFPDPYDEESAYYLSQILSQDLVIEVDKNVMEELRNIIMNAMGESILDDEAYILSGNALSIIYPVPTPIISRIVRDPMRGFAIWRRAQRELSNIQLRDKVLEALASRLAKAFSIIAEKQKTHFIVRRHSLKEDNYVLKEIDMDVYEGSKFARPISLAFIVMYEPSSSDIVSVIDIVLKKKNYLLPIIIYISREDLGPKIERYGLENIILKRISPNDALPIYAIDLALREMGIEEVESANRYLEIQIGRIGLYSSFRSMYERLRRGGYIISDLKGLKKPVEKPSEIIQYYQLLLIGVIDRDARGFIGSLKRTIDQYFYLRALRPYGKEFGKLGLLSIDIETRPTLRDRLNTAISVFRENSFLKMIDSDKYVIVNTPIENRILSILKEKGTINKKTLTSMFINIASNYPDELPDLYLDMLMSKGYVVSTKEGINLVTKEQLLEKLTQIREALINRLSELEDQFIRILKILGIDYGEETYGVLAYINCKKRECKLIKASTIRSLCDIVEDKEDLQLPLIYLYKELLKLYMDRVIPKFSDYIRKLDKEVSTFLNLKDNVTKMINDVYNDLMDVISKFKLDEIKQVVNNIEDFEENIRLKGTYESLIRHVTEILNTINKLNNPDEIVFPRSKPPNTLHHYLTSLEKDTIYPILEYIVKLNKEITEHYEHISNTVRYIKTRLGDIGNEYRKLMVLAKKYNLNEAILIRDLKREVSNAIIEIVGIIDSVDDIYNALDYVCKEINKIYGKTSRELYQIMTRKNNIQKIGGEINSITIEINTVESMLENILNDCLLLHGRYKDNLYTLIPEAKICIKIDEYKELIERLKDNIIEVRENIVKELENSITDEYKFDSLYGIARDKISNIRRKIEEVYKEIEEFAKGARTYLANAINEKVKVLTNMEKFVKDYSMKALIKTLVNRAKFVDEAYYNEVGLREYIVLLDDLVGALDSIKSIFYNIIESELSTLVPRERIDNVINELTETGKVKLSSLTKYLDIDSERALRILKVLFDRGIITDIEAII